MWKRRVAGVWVDGGGAIIGSTAAAQTMSAHEFARWQVRAALLDPLAYELLVGSAVSATVPAGRTWYMVSAWRVDSWSPGTLMQRRPDVSNENVVPLSAGETVTTEANFGAHAYLCKPELVTEIDPRYASDPKGLFYERLYRLDSELPKYDIGHNNTTVATPTTKTAFPTDFDYGIVLHVSAHDVAWCALHHATLDTALNLNNEISDDDRLRFSERINLPFSRALYPQIESRGAGKPEGTCNVRYVKLPADW